MNYKAIVHCSDSPFGGAVLIDKWHREERRWSAIGYHEVIENGYPTSDHAKTKSRIYLKDGMLATGRPYDSDEFIEPHEVGAHAFGNNRGTLAVCLIGDLKGGFRKSQIITLVKLLRFWQSHFGIAIPDMLGHCELPGVDKTCPEIDMDFVRRLVQNKYEAMALLTKMPLVYEGK